LCSIEKQRFSKLATMGMPDPPVVNLNRLRYFLVLADELHFGRAAERLHIAQPGLSQQIRKLERELDVRLLDRARRSFRLTPAGRLLRDTSRTLLDHAEDVVGQVRACARGETGQLRVAYTRSAADLSPAGLLQAFRQSHPGVDVHVTTGWTARNLELLDTGEIDAAFVRCPEPADRYTTLHLEDEELVVALPAGHPLAARRGIKPSDLEGQPVVMWPRAQGPGYYDRIIDQIWPGGPPRIVREEPEAEHILVAVANGAGIAVLDRRRATKLRPAGVLVRRFAAPRPHTELALIWRNSHQPAVLTSFIRSCRSSLT
jgi:DNA-binding transcriptional LysR family regulator